MYNIKLSVVLTCLVDSEVYCVLVVLSEDACGLSAGAMHGVYIYGPLGSAGAMVNRDWPSQQSSTGGWGVGVGEYMVGEYMVM